MHSWNLIGIGAAGAYCKVLTLSLYCHQEEQHSGLWQKDASYRKQLRNVGQVVALPAGLCQNIPVESPINEDQPTDANMQQQVNNGFCERQDATASAADDPSRYLGIVLWMHQFQNVAGAWCGGIADVPQAMYDLKHDFSSDILSSHIWAVC